MFDRIIAGNNTYLGVWLNETSQFIDIRDKAILLLQLPQSHFSPEATGSVVELLVCRINTDDMVTRTYQRIQGQEVGADSALSDDDILGRQLHALSAAVGSNAFSESLGSRDCAIRELDACVNWVLGGTTRHGDQVIDGHGSGACFSNIQDAWGCFIGVHPLLHGERGDANHC